MARAIDLSGKHVLVVGGSRGIGARAAVAAGEAGANVGIVYRSDASRANEVQREIEGLGRTSCVARADAADEGELKGAIEEIVRKLGPVDGLVVSAGIFEGSPIREMSVEFWDRTMAQNLRSTFLSVKLTLAHMAAGSIVIYTSTAGQRGSAVYSAYAASKGAQILFSRSMAKELAPHIRVNCIAPAWTETDMANDSLEQLGREAVAKQFPLGRIGRPEDVADATLFFLSDLSRFVTGTTLSVDGGMDMRG